jgi:hypothetical protein
MHYMYVFMSVSVCMYIHTRVCVARKNKGRKPNRQTALVDRRAGLIECIHNCIHVYTYLCRNPVDHWAQLVITIIKDIKIKFNGNDDSNYKSNKKELK